MFYSCCLLTFEMCFKYVVTKNDNVSLLDTDMDANGIYYAILLN